MEALMKAKVRGIYTTALTKLLLDNGFEIVYPSLTIKKRFGLVDNFAPSDVKIRDRYDLQGIRVLGTHEAVSRVHSILHSEFEDALTRKWNVSVDGIYNGKVVDESEETVYVEIGAGVIGRLHKSEFVAAKDKQLLVQVERKRIGAREPVLTTNLKIVGNYAILVRNGKGGVSLKILELSKRAELYALGKLLAPDGWGIIWRESSANQQKETLENEIATLTEKIKSLNENASQTGSPTVLVEGSCFMDVELPWSSKKNLDRLRATVAQTLDGHHFYKACGGNVSATLEMAEKHLEDGKSRSGVEESFAKQVLYEFPEAGSQVNVEHVKLSGVVFHLGQAVIESLGQNNAKYSRIMQSDGFYDGLDVKKESGDKAVSETKTGEWHITTKYYSQDGEWKGTYINLNTPLEVYPQTLRYVDLEVDVCIQPDGTVKVLDMEKLEKALEKQIIGQKLFAKVKGTLEEILEK